MIAQSTSNKPASFYEAYAAQHIEVNETDEGQLYCTIPSEQNMSKRYEVKCIEHKDSVEVKSCNCLGHKRHGHCKHAAIVQNWWNRIYKSSQEKLAAKVARQEAEAAVAEAERIIATSLNIPAEEVEKIAAIAVEYKQEIKPKHPEMNLPIGPRDTKKDWTKANFGTRAFSFMR